MKGRIQIIDAARGLALICMAIYHCAWDLSMFGYVSQATIFGSGWTLFARAIASSFLFLVGFSIVISGGFESFSFLKRWLQVAIAAIIISIATYIFMPESFIFFGILHLIAFSLILGSIMITAPWYLFLMGAIFVFFAADHVTSELFSAPWAAFIGLSANPVNSVDFVPVFPWFSAVLLGMAAGKVTIVYDKLPALAKITSPLFKPFALLGRWSLVFYLVHQPILIALIFAISQIAPPALL